MLHGKVKLFSPPGAQETPAHRPLRCSLSKTSRPRTRIRTLRFSSPAPVSDSSASAALCSLVGSQKTATTSLRPSAHTASFFRVAAAWEEMELCVFPFRPTLALWGGGGRQLRAHSLLPQLVTVLCFLISLS